MPMPSEEKLFSITPIAQDFSDSAETIEGAKELKDTVLTLEQQTANAMKLTKSRDAYSSGGGFGLFKALYQTLIPLYKKAEDLAGQIGNTMKVYGKNFGNIGKKLKDYLIKFNYIRDRAIDIGKGFRGEVNEDYALMGEYLALL